VISITEEKTCCGCGACAAACPANCIEMVSGTLGAVFPRVDKEECIECGKCETVCPMLHAKELKHISGEQAVYAAYAKDPKLRHGGSSGGMFGTIAKHLLAKGYRVYGAAFDESLKLRCMSADTEEALAPLMKSKYLQSDLSGTYGQVRQDLQQGKRVLFVSTPCQVAALKRYLSKDYENLITVDFLCHGVPSQEFFDKCRAYEEKKHGCKTLSYAFRTKIPGGATPHYFTVAVQKNGKQKSITKPYFQSVYYAFFQQYITLRESCYDCTFAEQGRVSDMTIADFHDIEKYEPSVNRFDGVSTVIVNTEKGKVLFDGVKDTLWTQPFSMERLIGDKVLFAEKTKRPARRDAFIESYETAEFASFVKQNLNKKRYAIYAVYYKLPKALRAIVRKICHIA